jgi:hypothetical protein
MIFRRQHQFVHHITLSAFVRHVLLIFGMCLLAGCIQGDKTMTTLPSEVATTDLAAVSPSGAYTLRVTETDENGIPTQRFQILDQSENVVFASDQGFDVRHMTYFLWDASDRVWVYSGDIGTYFWEHNPDTGAWEQAAYARSEVPAPDFLKQSRPNQHPR